MARRKGRQPPKVLWQRRLAALAAHLQETVPRELTCTFEADTALTLHAWSWTTRLNAGTFRGYAPGQLRIVRLNMDPVPGSDVAGRYTRYRFKLSVLFALTHSTLSAHKKADGFMLYKEHQIYRRIDFQPVFGDHELVLMPDDVGHARSVVRGIING